jgi:hypothetical protein
VAQPHQPPATEVQLLRWPADADRRAELSARHVPRLLLVDEGASPPVLDPDEDWIRVPTDERDVWARLQRLAERRREQARRPTLTDGVVLGYLGQTVVVSAGEAEVLRLLLDHFGQVVHWDELRATLWPDGGGTPKLANARVSRLRTRIAATGLVVHNLRSRGVMLAHGSAEEDPWPTS